MNYKTDDSFFTTVFPPFVYYGWSVKSWLLQDENAIFRYIRDYEIEQEFWNIEQVNDIYPEIKTITITVNPWARMYYAYQQLHAMKQANDYRLVDLTDIPLDTFSNFVNSLPSMPATNGDFWFSIPTPICKWIDYEVNGDVKTADYILRDYALEEDFQKIQEYFQSDVPLAIESTLPDYREQYTSETQKIITDVFKKDIERFGFEF